MTPPRCAAARLQLRRSCSATTLRCRCGADLALAELVEQIDDKTFARLAELVGDTLADRL